MNNIEVTAKPKSIAHQGWNQGWQKQSTLHAGNKEGRFSIKNLKKKETQ